jgi:hypothetical protein
MIGTKSQQKYFDSLFTITKKDIIYAGGGGLLKQYNFSPAKLISTVFAEHEWLPWKFTVVPTGYWVDPNNHRKFLDWVAKQLNIKEMKDWYNVTKMVLCGDVTLNK